MGLFDLFTGSKVEFSPEVALGAGLIFMSAADGSIEEEELIQMAGVLGPNGQPTLKKALQYCKSTDINAYLQQAAGLTRGQKMCILVNVLDSLLSDGHADASEQQLFNQFLQAFGVRQEEFAPFFEAICIKNDKRVLTDPAHPRNR